MSNSSIMEAAEMMADKFLIFTSQHGLVIAALVFIGIFAIIATIGDKVFNALKYIFMLFIATPLIFILAIIKRGEREERKKEIGEIRAFLRENPDKRKKFIYGVVFFAFLLFIAFIFWWFISRFIAPINEASKLILENYTTNSSIR